MSLTSDQQALFVLLDMRAKPSGDQTPEQARNLAVDSFVHACALEGLRRPSERAVREALRAD
jgi:hypothetical protein